MQFLKKLWQPLRSHFFLDSGSPIRSRTSFAGMTNHNIKLMLHMSHSRESGNPDFLPGLFEKLLSLWPKSGKQQGINSLLCNSSGVNGNRFTSASNAFTRYAVLRGGNGWMPTFIGFQCPQLVNYYPFVNLEPRSLKATSYQPWKSI